MKRCPFCDKLISSVAIRCKHCRRLLVESNKKSLEDELYDSAKIYWHKWRTHFPEKVPIPWDWKIVSLFIALSFAIPKILQISAFLGLFVDWLRRHYFVFIREPLLQEYVFVYLNTIIVKCLIVGLIFVYIRLKKQGSPLFLLGLKTREPQYLRLFTLAFILTAAFLAICFGNDPLLPNLPTALFFIESAFIGNILSVLAICVIAPLTEEIFFRGFVYPAVDKKCGPEIAILLTSLLFTAAHYHQTAQNPGLLVVIFLVGLAITYARAVTGSTRYAVILHAFYNLAIVLVGFIHYGIIGY